MSFDVIYKDEDNLNHIDEAKDRCTSGDEEDSDEKVSIEMKYQCFLEKCGDIFNEFDWELVQEFVSLFYGTEFLLIEPILETNFVNSLLNEIKFFTSFNFLIYNCVF